MLDVKEVIVKIMANYDLRTAAKNAGVPLWAIADALHISEPTMTRKLRRELPEKEKQQMLGIIKHLAMEESDNAEI